MIIIISNVVQLWLLLSAKGPNDITGVWDGAHNGVQGQSPWSGGQRDEVPMKLTTFSYFIDYFLNKIIT